MAQIAISGDPTISGVVLAEQASTPSTPAAGKSKLYIDTSGALKVVDDAGAVSTAGGVHALESATHTTAGGTDGYALRQTGATAFAWEAEYAALAFTFGDGAGAIVAATEPDQWLEVPFGAVITSWRIVADVAGAVVVDVWRDSYANVPPTVADTITASAKPTLASASKGEDTLLSGWSTTLVRGDWLRVHVESAATIRRVVLSLGLRKT